MTIQTETAETAAPEEGDRGAIPSRTAGAWHREYPDGWEFLLPGPAGGILRVPYEATDSDRPLHEQLQRFADSIDLVPQPDVDRPKNIVEALARCILEMPSIAKDQDMGEGGQRYKYRSIEQVTSHASALFGRYVVVPKPHKIKRKVREITLGGKPWTEDLLRVKYRIYGPGGRKDFIDTAWFHALARDNSDKGTNKAMTQAFKQMLLQLLVVGDNKDDPDTYRPESDGSRREERPLTVDEWSLANGWDSNEQRMETAKWVRRLIKALTDAAQLDPGGAHDLWEDYKRPARESLGGGEGPRTWTEHCAWMQANLPDTPKPWTAPAQDPSDAQQAPEAQDAPEPAATPAATQEPGPVPESGPAPDTPAAAQPSERADDLLEKARVLSAEPWPPAPEPPAPAREEAADPEPQPPAPEAPASNVEAEAGRVEDNGYRSELDQAFVDSNVDGLLSAMREMGIDVVVRELRARGVAVEGKHQPDALRRDLGALILRWHKAPGAERPARSRRRS